MRRAADPARRSAVHAAAALALQLAAGPAWAQALPMPGAFDPWRPRGTEKSVEQWLDEAEQRLVAGDAQAALDTLQQAANRIHSPAVECAIVRAQVQAGAYRQALAFCAHAALSHRGFPAALGLYVWLLHLGGQPVIGARLLHDALRQQPDAALLQQVRAGLAADWPQPTAALLELPARCAPYAHGAAAEGAAVVGTAVLAASGDAAWIARELVTPGRALWVRNGLGQTVRATLDRRHGRPGWLALDGMLPVPAISASGRPVFAGSPVATIEYPPDAAGAARWPLLRQGFAGRAGVDGGSALGIEMPRGARGGPVFDRAGLLAGIAASTPAGDRLVPSRAVALGYPTGSAASTVDVPLDAVYEAGLRIALQVLA